MLPFTTEEEVLDFLAHAEIVDAEEVSGGVNSTYKLLLERDGVRAHAAFRSVERRRDRVELGEKTIVGFHDSYRYEVAAYELARLLGLQNVPPATLRRIDGVAGSVQIWIEDVMTEDDRLSESLKPPNHEAFFRQQHLMRLFDRLIYNYDRNQGNVLIDGDWRLWMIDHTRSFYTAPDVAGIRGVTVCDRELWERLCALDEEEVRERLGPYLGRRQLRALWKRREKAIVHVTSLIDQFGYDAVIYPHPS